MPSRGSAAGWAPSRKISRGVMQHQKHTHTPHYRLDTKSGLTDRARGEHAWTQKTHQQVLLGEDRITRDSDPKQELGDAARHECWEHGHA